MGQTIPTRQHFTIGDDDQVTRRAVSYTPTSDIIVRYWSFVAQRTVNSGIMYATIADLNETDSIDWEIRTAVANHKPGTAAGTLLASGSFDWRYTTAWRLYRPIKYTVNLSSPLTLDKDTEYFFILKIPSDAISLYNPIGWFSTYDGTAGSIDATVYSSLYYNSAWTDGVATYNLTRYILDEQAGEEWHVVINGEGYMQPDNMRGYRCETVASGITQTRGGQSEYSQLRYPYANLSQSNWFSGSGQLDMRDQSAFLFSASMDTSINQQAIMGPQVHMTGTTSLAPGYDSDEMRARYLVDHELGTPLAPVRYFAQPFTAPVGGMTATSVGVQVSRSPWQRAHTFQIAIFSNSGGSPGSNLTGWLTISPTYKWLWRDATISGGLALTTAVAYWVVVRTSQELRAMPEYKVRFDQDGSGPGGAAKYSPDGTTWTVLSGADAQSMFYRINQGPYGELNGDVVKIVHGDVNEVLGLYALAGKEVYKWNTSTGVWDPLTAGLTANGTDMICFADKLVVAQGYANVMREYNGTTWSDGDEPAKYFHIGKGFLWASTNENKVQRSAALVTWSAEITVGVSEYEITAFNSFQGRLLVGKEDGIWEVDEQDLAMEYLIFREQASATNCQGWAVWSGMLFIPVQSSIWRWQGSQYKDVGPTTNLASQTSDFPNKIRRLAPTSQFLFAVGEPLDATGFGGLLVYNGLGWHHLTTATQQNLDARAICVTTEESDGYMAVWFAEGKRITYVKYPLFTGNRYDWDDADFSNTASSLLCSWWDGGLKDALKFWNRVTVIADIPDDTSIEVYCARDGDDWASATEIIYLGTLRNDQLSETGEYTLFFPDGMVAKRVQPIFIFDSDDTSVTPRLHAYNIESIVRQPPVYVYTFRVLLADNITKMDGSTEEDRDANDMWVELQEVAMTNEPIIVSFPFKSIRGMVSFLREETAAFRAQGPEEELWDRTAVVSVVEAT